MKKIAICGGHLTPALALIEELEANKSIRIIFFGRKHSAEGSKNLSAEYEIIKEKNIKFYEITAGRIQRKLTSHTIPALVKIPIGFIQSFFYLLLSRPSVVVSFGGYLSTPVVFSAWLLGISAVTHEQAIVPGLANRLNALFAQKVYLSWEDTKKYFKESKAIVIGNCVRKSLTAGRLKDKRLKDFVEKSQNLVFVTGGNQGSHFLNSLITSSIKGLDSFQILHQVGNLNFKNDLEKAQKIKSKNYMAIKYISPDQIGEVFKIARIVVSRSGANTIWELATFQKPAILVPLPTSGANEQLHNAKKLESAGMAKTIEQKDLNPQVLEKTLSVIENNYATFEQNAKSFNKTLPKDAAAKLSRDILGYT